MANIDVEKLKEKLYPAASALFCIGEVCVDVSKWHISAEDAINKIRGYLSKTEVHSRACIDRLIEDCMLDEYVFTTEKEALDSLPKADADRIAKAKKNIARYTQR